MDPGPGDPNQLFTICLGQQLQTVEPIQELEREGRLEEALVVCYAAIGGAERARNGREPAPWYTEQAAIIHRKLGQPDQEIAVLQRWLRACPADRRSGSGIKRRLDKLTSSPNRKTAAKAKHALSPD